MMILISGTLLASGKIMHIVFFFFVIEHQILVPSSHLLSSHLFISAHNFFHRGINHPRSIRLWAASNEGGKPSSFPQDITFADLAALLVPAYFKDSVDACLSVIIPASSVEGEPVTSTSVMPGEVYALRKTLLKTRDLFDIFSTVYPTQTNVMTELFIDDTKDLWRILRVYLMDGYRLIGDFQDLSHAKIMYTPEQLADYQVQVWTWKTDFMTFVQENLETIFDYLYTPCNRNNRKHDHCRFAHSHVSHLFWGTTPDEHLPHGNVDKAKHVLARLGNIQLKRAEKYLHKSLTYEYILNSTKATTSSRNLIERQLESSGNELMSEDSNADEIDENNGESKDEETDESEENGTDPEEIDDDEKDESKEDSAVDIDDEETDDEDETDDIDDDENEESNEDSDDEKNEINDNDSDEYVDVQLIYHNCRKQLRGFLDELSIFGNLLLPNTSVIPELLRNADTAATSHTLDPAAKILTDQAVKKLDETRTVLGDLNDAYVSHQFYQEHDMYPDEQLRLQVSVESKWRHFRKWQTDNDLVGKMHVLRTMMMKPNLTWSLAPSISPIPTSESTVVSPITPTSVSPISNAPTIGPTTASPLSEEPTLGPTKNPVTDEPTSSNPSSVSSAISVTDAVKEKQHKKKRKNVESPGETTPESDKEE